MEGFFMYLAGNLASFFHDLQFSLYLSKTKKQNNEETCI